MNRRTFLRGLGGVALALPFLETFALRRAGAQTPPRTKRFVVFFECNGVNMERFFPGTPHGPLTDASFMGRSIEPLVSYREKILMPRGIHTAPFGYNAGMIPSAGCDHQKGMGHKLTAMPLQDTADHYASGPSVDQVIARAVNPPGRAAMSLLVGPQSRGVTGSISYTGPGMPVVGENNPFLVYRDMMGMSPTMMPMNDPLALRRRSVLDVVREEMDDLRRQNLSTADQQKLDMHFTAIRDVEMGMTGTGMVACTLPAATTGELMALDPATIDQESQYRTIGRLHMDVMSLALACGHTRVASLQWGGGAGGPIFRWDGMNHTYNHHKLSHGTTMDNGGETVAGYLEMLADIDRWHANQFKYLLDKLQAYDEGGHSVLDNSAVVWMNELSDGKDHDFRDLPYLIAGSCGGYFRTGQYPKLTARPESDRRGGWWDGSLDAPHNRLLVSFMNAMGVTDAGGNPMTRFGHPDLPSGEYTELKVA